MIKLFLLSFSLVFLFSCSKLETALQFAPRIVSNRVDDAFDLRSAKLSELRKKIESEIDASKKDVALKLITHADAVLELSKKDKITPDDVRLLIEAFKVTQGDVVQKFKGSFEVVLNELTAEEIANFKEYSDEKFEDQQEEATDRKKLLAARKKSALKTFGYFFDDISDEQEKLTEAFVERHYTYFVERIKIRKAFGENFYAKLQKKEPTVDFVMNYYSGGVKEFSSGPVKDYLDDYYKFQAEFWNLTSAEEKENFRENMNDYKVELQKIAGVN